jgi:hypothetical protein
VLKFGSLTPLGPTIRSKNLEVSLTVIVVSLGPMAPLRLSSAFINTSWRFFDQGLQY